MKICGPKLSLFGVVISVWGIIQLVSIFRHQNRVNSDFILHETHHLMSSITLSLKWVKCWFHGRIRTQNSFLYSSGESIFFYVSMFWLALADHHGSVLFHTQCRPGRRFTSGRTLPYTKWILFCCRSGIFTGELSPPQKLPTRFRIIWFVVSFLSFRMHLIAG